MPNTYLKAPGRMALALAALHQVANWSNLITRIDGNGFIGALNDRVEYDTEGVTTARDYEWRTRTAPVIFDEIYRTKLYVKLDKHTYQGVKFTDEEEKLDLTSYGREILLPQVKAIAKRLDSKVVTALLAADWAVTNLTLSAAGDELGNKALMGMLGVKRAADAAGVPDDGRMFLAGANAYVWLAASSALQKYDPSQAKTAFQEGVAGRIAGMDLVDGTSILGDNEFVVLHRSWGVLANLAPSVPAGVTWGQRSTYEGWSLRVVRQYSLDYLTDRSLVSTFTGISEVKDQYARWTSGTISAATDGSEVGDIIIVDGEPTFTGKNARGAKGTFTPFT